MTGLIVALLLLAAVAAGWWWLFGQHIAPARHRREAVEARDTALWVHDFSCDTGRWPHEGDCTVDGDEDDFVSVVGRWQKLAECMAGHGIGRCPDLASVGNGTLLIPRSVAGDWDPSKEPHNPLLPQLVVVDDDDPRLGGGS